MYLNIYILNIYCTCTLLSIFPIEGHIFCRLLNPDLDSSSSLFVERLITQLIQKYPAHMAPHIKDLVAALVRRMETSEIMGLKNSLILIFARLVREISIL
jgi:hypothetical protein